MNNVIIKNKKAQAMLELAIFGSIMLMLLGVLVSYGLRYNYQQLEMQRAFRLALASSATSMSPGTPSSVAHMIVEDRHIPNPGQAFGMGAITPFSSGGSVTRSAALQETPDSYVELPETQYTINDKVLTFKTAGFIEEYDVPSDRITKYQYVYGDSISAWNNTLGWVYYKNGSSTCTEWGEFDPWTNTTPCLKSNYNQIRYINGNAGEIISYEGMRRQCRIIVDSEVCKDQCVESGGTDCANVCAMPIAVPWYCGTQGVSSATDYVETDSINHVYSFPVIEQLFAFAKKDKQMGLQADTLQQVRKEAKLSKKETVNNIETRDTINLSTRTSQNFVWKKYGDTTTNVEVMPIISNSERKQDRIWRTPWD